MKQMAWPNLAVIGALLAVSPAAAGPRYENARYGYSIDLPDRFSMLSEANNGDGGVAISEDGQSTLRIFGANILEGDFKDEVQLRLSRQKADGWEISYTLLKSGFASYSGLKGDMVLYVRLIASCDVSFAVFELEYPKTQLKTFNPVVKSLVQSFTTRGCLAAPASPVQ